MKTNEQSISATENFDLFDSTIITTQPEVVERVRTWIAALRSGKYKQGKSRLKSNGKYCCLGVANEVCKLNEPSNMSLENTFSKVGLRTNAGYFNPVEDPLRGFLTNANDEWDWTFEDIATFIENQLNAALALPQQVAQ